nr:type II toxin-antitoxin system VapB family antitoxin [Acidiferrobacter sp.]
MADLAPPHRDRRAHRSHQGGRRQPSQGVSGRLREQHAGVGCIHTHTADFHDSTTRLFKNGHSQAVRIPADLTYERTDREREIERVGDELRIRPTRQRLDHLLEKLSRFFPDFLNEGRGDDQEGERDPL